MSPSTMEADPVAGWYEDPLTPTAMRWWNGQGWTEHTQAPPSPAGDFASSWATFFDGPSAAPAAPAVAPVPAAPAVAPVPAAPAAPTVTAPVLAPTAPTVTAPLLAPTLSTEPTAAPTLATDPTPAPALTVDDDLLTRSRSARADRVATVAAESSWLRPTHWNTPGVWLLAFTPWISVLIAATLGVLATVGAAWYVMLAAALLMPLLWIAFAVRDRRRLAGFGYQKRASWAWVILSPFAYLIARGVRVHRVSGGGWAPLWVLLVNVVLVAGAGLGVSMFVKADLLPQQLHAFETTIANDYAGPGSLPRP